MAGRKTSQSDATVVAEMASDRGQIPQVGFWISEDNYTRLERAATVARLLACVDQQIAEQAAISRDGIAGVLSYIANDLQDIVDAATLMKR